ncbi:hypothetical protein [Nocardiopsis trehalosi]|jgi:hypothetical protein|nr:hypothetical protein [Nocardiopsis trehalosi]
MGRHGDQDKGEDQGKGTPSEWDGQSGAGHGGGGEKTGPDAPDGT